MKAGYGRGYYGEGQLAHPPSSARKGRGWVKWALAVGAVGAGAAVWFMWPRKTPPGAGEGNPRLAATPTAAPIVGPSALLPVQLTLAAPQPVWMPRAEPQGYMQESARGHYGQEAPWRPVQGFAEGYDHRHERDYDSFNRAGRSVPSDGRGPFDGSDGRGPFEGSEQRRAWASPEHPRRPDLERREESQDLEPSAPEQPRAFAPDERGTSHSTRRRSSSSRRAPLSQQAYEDAVVASARELQATGAKVVLAPHLAHLTPRIRSS